MFIFVFSIIYIVANLALLSTFLPQANILCNSGGFSVTIKRFTGYSWKNTVQVGLIYADAEYNTSIENLNKRLQSS